jgi:hypothetical protein
MASPGFSGGAVSAAEGASAASMTMTSATDQRRFMVPPMPHLRHHIGRVGSASGSGTVPAARAWTVVHRLPLSLALSRHTEGALDPVVSGSRTTGWATRCGSGTTSSLTGSVL